MTPPSQAFAPIGSGNYCGAIRLLVLWIAVLFAGTCMAAQVALSNLTQTYNGSPKSATVTTVPAGLNCIVTYDGSPTLPTNAGSYAVLATVDSAGETGSAAGTLVISKASQTITFATLSAKTYGDAPFNLTATSTSGLPISYTSSKTAVATISGSTVTITGAGTTSFDFGTTTITASQAGNLNYNPAPSVGRTQKVNKKLLTYSLVLPADKTYGDAPFTVSATVSGGLSIAKWESADPSVASVSPTGLVTIVGAGQTSIIASIASSGSTNYDPSWIARPLNVARSPDPLPSGTQTVTYNGSNQGIDPVALPTGQATEITYRDTSLAEAAPADPQVVFQNGPDTLDLSYYSTAFASANIWGLAKNVTLGGTARKLSSCDVTLVTWAGYYGGKDSDPTYRYKEWADAHPGLAVPPNPGISIPGNSGGYYHPVTLSFYNYEGDGISFRLLASQTVLAFIPWRPETNQDGTTYPNSGYAFRVPFSFPDGVILPEEVCIGVSCNTNGSGVAPVGASGPYDALNVSDPSGEQVGSTPSSNTYLYRNWRWQLALNSVGPMLRLRAVPTNATIVAPLNAGTYEVKTKEVAFGTGAAISTLIVNKAPLAIALSNLSQVRDGTPKSVTVGTTPSGISTSVSYAGSPDAPSSLGIYPVTAASANANYEGLANATMHIGDSFSSWKTAKFASSGLPLEKTGDTADPDGDGLSNLLEYAFNLDPIIGDSTPATKFGYSGNTLSFRYRRNLHALDLNYSLQGTSNLGDPLSWAPVTPQSETTVSDDGATRVIQATVAEPTGQPRYFLRMKTSR